MRYRVVHDDGREEVFEYGTPNESFGKPEGLRIVEWLMNEVGEHDKDWTIHYDGGFVQFWFKRQEDFVKFSLFWS